MGVFRALLVHLGKQNRVLNGSLLIAVHPHHPDDTRFSFFDLDSQQ
jgi:hypothetical protein